MMTADQITNHLRTWATLNAQEVYGSPREFISIDALTSELSKIDAVNAEASRY